MIPRALTPVLKRAARRFPVVTLTGPRQSGKTTLVKKVFQNYTYVSLETPDEREFALEDPKGFLGRFEGPVILDEIQRAPDLFSYIQVLVDRKEGKPGLYILTGSQNFLLMEKISQSLAGRCAVLHLLPFSMAELQGRPPLNLGTPIRSPGKKCSPPRKPLEDYLFTGFYPRIHDKKLPPRDWLSAYYQTYVERDVRTLTNVGDLETFGRFVRLCAGRTGQVLNLTGLASDCGISHTTARRWISVLEAGFLVALLRPHFRNFGKRLVKRPKLYFLDTGLLCFLLQVQKPAEILHRAERGAIFESFVLSEVYKNYTNRGERPPIYFWRDASGHEVDFLLESGAGEFPIEAKSSRTVVSDFFKGIHYWREISENPKCPAALVYGGDQAFRRSGVDVLPWFCL